MLGFFYTGTLHDPVHMIQALRLHIRRSQRLNILGQDTYTCLLRNFIRQTQGYH